MSNIEIKRTFEGELTLFVSGNPALGSKIVDIQRADDGKLKAIVVIPLEHATFGEVNNVLPFRSPVETKRA